MAPGPYEQWIALDLEWVAVCDALIRLPGESAGADGEREYAITHGIPTYNSVEHFLVAGPDEHEFRLARGERT